MSGEAVIHLTKPGDRESNKNKEKLYFHMVFLRFWKP